MARLSLTEAIGTPRLHAGPHLATRMAIDKLLKRHFWAVILALVAIAAFFDAQGIMQIVGASLGADDKQLAAAPARRGCRRRRLGESARHGADAILSRNPFDSVTGPLERRRAAEVAKSRGAPPPPDMSDPFNAPDCDGVTSSSSPPRPTPTGRSPRSRPPQDKGKSFLRRRGGEIGGKTVEFIGWDRVWLTSGSQLCQSQMFKPPPRRRSAPGTPRAAPCRRRRRPRRVRRTSRRASRASAPTSSTSTAASSTRSSRTRPS